MLTCCLNKCFSTVFAFLIFLFSMVSHAATTSFKVADFSQQYEVKIEFDARMLANPKGNLLAKIYVYEIKSGRQLMESRMVWDNAALNYSLPYRKSQILFYRDQDWFVYEDINFDGIKDFALRHTWQGSCAMCPLSLIQGYKLFLGKEDGKFIYNHANTVAMQADLPSLLSVDNKRQRLNQSLTNYHKIKSHQAEYYWQGDELILDESVTYYEDGLYTLHKTASDEISQDCGCRKKVVTKRLDRSQDITELAHFKRSEQQASLFLSNDELHLLIEHADGTVAEKFNAFAYSKLQQKQVWYFDGMSKSLHLQDDGRMKLRLAADETLEGELLVEEKTVSAALSNAKNINNSYRITSPSSPYYVQLNLLGRKPLEQGMHGFVMYLMDKNNDQLLANLGDGVVDFKPEMAVGQSDEWHYEKQNSLQITDINGDGKADVIIRHPANCYTCEKLKNPRYTVYLQGSEGFAHSEVFDKLLRDKLWRLQSKEEADTEYALLIAEKDVDDGKTWEKSVEAYALVNGKPVLMERESRSNRGQAVYYRYLKEKRNSPQQNLQRKTQWLFNAQEHRKDVFQINLPESELTLLFYQHEQQLFATVINAQGELVYAEGSDKKAASDFHLEVRPNNQTLIFTNKLQNTLRLAGQQLTVDLHLEGQRYNWTAELSSEQQADFQALIQQPLANVKTRMLPMDIPGTPYYVLFVREDLISNHDAYEGDTVIVIDRDKGRILIEAPIYLRFFSDLLEDSKQSIAFDQQSIVHMKDVNFDGKDDLLILESWHRSPSYNVYLADENGFEFNEDLSAVTANSCELFTVDAENKTLITGPENDDICQHGRYVYTFKDGELYLLEQEFYVQKNEDYIYEEPLYGELVEGDTYRYKRGENGFEPVPTRLLKAEKLVNDQGDFKQWVYLYYEFADGEKVYFFMYRENFYFVYTTPDDKIIDLITDNTIKEADGEQYFYFKNEFNQREYRLFNNGKLEIIQGDQTASKKAIKTFIPDGPYYACFLGLSRCE